MGAIIGLSAIIVFAVGAYIYLYFTEFKEQTPAY
jgi:hypothetical protein